MHDELIAINGKKLSNETKDGKMAIVDLFFLNSALHTLDEVDAGEESEDVVRGLEACLTLRFPDLPL